MKLYTVYQLIKHYHMYCTGDYDMDSWEGVRGEYDTREEIDKRLAHYVEWPDTAATFYCRVVRRNFPACKKCQGSGSDTRKCTCFNLRKAWIDRLHKTGKAKRCDHRL